MQETKGIDGTVLNGKIKQGVIACTRHTWLTQNQVVGCHECGHESSNAQQAGNFLTLYLLSNHDFSRSPTTEMVAVLVKTKWQRC